MAKSLTGYQRNEALRYLDGLRDSATVRMDTGYTPTYLFDVFGYDYGTAWELLQEWLAAQDRPLDFRYSGKAKGLWPLIAAMDTGHGEDSHVCAECERPIEADATACVHCTASDHWETPHD